VIGYQAATVQPALERPQAVAVFPVRIRIVARLAFIFCTRSPGGTRVMAWRNVAPLQRICFGLGRASS